MKPSDQSVRLQALDPAHSFIVQAPAGSGKTEVLTQRYLRLLATVKKPERVLAITFTRKATQEMRTRILSRLMQARSGDRPDSEHDQRAFDLAVAVLQRDQERGWNLLENPGRLRITTIDGLCVQLLSRDPVHGPLWSGVRVLEDARPLYRETIRRMFADVDEAGTQIAGDQAGGAFVQDALVSVLVRLGGDGRRLEELLMEMLSGRSLWKRHLDAGPTGFAQLLTIRQEMALESLQENLGASLLAEAMALVESLGHDLGAGKPGAADRVLACHSFCRLMGTTKQWPIKPGTIGPKWFPDMGPGGEENIQRLKEIFGLWHESEQAVESFRRMASWPPLDIQLDDEADKQAGSGSLLDDMRGLLALALYELETVCAERGEADFTAVSDVAVTSLGSESAPADTLLAEDGRIDHILMDEFQDTSFTQFSLLRGLTAGWQAGDGRTLFLVGDPMQSIYRFREANVGFFNDIVTSGRFGAIEIRDLSLTSNFRSRAELIEWFNDTFPRVFPDRDESDSGAVSYTAVHPERDRGGTVGLHVFNAADTENNQYTQLVKLVSERLAASPRSSIAILVRGRNQIPPLTEALDRNGIAYDAVAMRALQARQVVMDLRILTRALVHPHDRVAWIAMLRAPWCGLAMREIHAVVGDDPAETVLSRIGDERNLETLDPASGEKLLRVHGLMNYARQIAPRESLSRLVEMCWIQLGGPLCCADNADIEDAQVYLDLLTEVEQTGPEDLVEALEEVMEKRYATSRPASVQLMTIHNAKGLQFDTVIVPDLARTTGNGSQPLIALQEFAQGPDGDGVLMAPLTPSYISDVSLYRYLGKVDAERSRFEDMRLLYVACTRAREELHLLADVKLTAKGQPSIRADSFLGFLQGVFEPVLNKLEPLGDDADSAAEENGEPPVVPLLRLSGRLPNPESGLPADCGDTLVGRALEELPNREAAALGTVLHEWLELVHDHPTLEWNRERIERAAPSIRSGLLRAGAPDSALDELSLRCRDILLDVLFSRDWLGVLRAGRSQGSWSELPIYLREGNRISRHIIDLLARNTEGQYEIIDYKTRPPGEASAEKWDLQLERYRQLVEKLGSGPVADTRIEILAGDSSPPETAC